MRHSIRSNGAGDLAPGMATFSSALLASPAASPLPAGNYTVTSDSPIRATPSVDGKVLEPLAAGAQVVVFGPVNNYFADVMAPGVVSTWGVRGWLSVANLAPAAQQGAAQPGGPNTGANTPPGGVPPIGTTPIVTQGGTPPSTSSMPTWLLPALGAAALGWFFLVEQKQKGGRRR